VTWELAADDGFTTVLRRGVVTTDALRDHTVHVDVTGLAPYTRYWYRFRALGVTSPVGRTQTAPDEAGRRHALRFVACSCANYTGGFFSAYRAIAERDDLDLVLFLGDYIYEYGNGGAGGDYRYGPAELAGTRDVQPGHEIFTLADYRLRYARYRSDPDLQAAHRRHPWVLILDDHEVADNTWKDGNSGDNNRRPAPVPFAQRKASAYKAYLEWLPVRLPDQRVPHDGTRFWRSFRYGSLATLFCLETRQNRSEQAKPVTSSNLFSVDAATLDDPNRHLPEPAEMAWLQDGLAQADAGWHLVANQVVFAPVRVPSTPQMLDALGGPLELAGVAAGGVVFNADQWDGYVADQRALTQAIASRAKGSVVFLTGDIHSGWANDIPADAGTYVPAGPLNNSVAVEFVTPSITSESIGDVLASTAMAPASAATGLGAAAAASIQAGNRHVRYLEPTKHGFCVVDVTPARVQCDWWYVSDRLDPQATASFGAAQQTVAGSRQVSAAAAPIGPRSDDPRVLPATGTRRTPTRRPSGGGRTGTGGVRAPTRGLAATGGGTDLGLAAVVATAVAGVLVRVRRRWHPLD
jgi:alkaline phosphatase D